MAADLTLTDNDGSTLHYTVDNNAGTATLTSVDPSPVRTNRDNIHAAANTALANNREYLTLNPPTAAQVGAQVRALTRQVQGLIRLTLNALNVADDT